MGNGRLVYRCVRSNNSIEGPNPQGRVMGMPRGLDVIASGGQTRTPRRNREPGCLARALFLGLAIPIERMPIVFLGGA